MEKVYLLPQLWKVVKRRSWLLVIPMLVSTLVTALVVLFLMAPTYEASTTLLVGKNEPFDARTVLNYEDVLLNQQLVKTYGEIAKSWTVLDDVIGQLDCPITVEELRKLVSVSHVAGTQIIRLSAQHRDPVLAQSIANTAAFTFTRRLPQLLNLNKIGRAHV